MQLPRRLARKMLDLQFLPHLMITNPHVRQVYNEYFQAFETLRDTPEITCMAQNREFTAILENLLAQHGAYLLLGVSLRAFLCLSSELMSPACSVANSAAKVVASQSVWHPKWCGLYTGPMIDSLAIGLKECRRRRGMAEHVRLDHFLDGMLQALSLIHISEPTRPY